MADNIDIFDFALTEEEMARINALPQKPYYVVPDEPPAFATRRMDRAITRTVLISLIASFSCRTLKRFFSRNNLSVLTIHYLAGRFRQAVRSMFAY